MTTLGEKKRAITNELQHVSASPALDALCIICHVTQKTTAQCITDANDPLDSSDIKAIDAFTADRKNGKPIAYIIGKKAFWSLDLIVTPDTLIPRPDTECLVEWVLDHFKDSKTIKAADLGTGPGTIALALAIEKANWVIDATDISTASEVLNFEE